MSKPLGLQICFQHLETKQMLAAMLWSSSYTRTLLISVTTCYSPTTEIQCSAGEGASRDDCITREVNQGYILPMLGYDSATS